MIKTSKILVTGHNGLVGSAIIRDLSSKGYTNILTMPDHHKSSGCNLMDKLKVDEWFMKNRPEYVFHCAGKVGGIVANKTYPVEFFLNNLIMGTNVINSSYGSFVKKVINCGSTCIFPKECPQPIKEEYLLTSALEPSNEAYALAKIGVLKLCEYYNSQFNTNFITVMPTNQYGKFDSYHPQNSHVLPAIIRKTHEAKLLNAPSITIWGDGSPIREFMYVDDTADALVFLMETYNASSGIINIGTGIGHTIKETYEIAMDVIGYKGELIFDVTKPNGTPVKITDVTKLNNLGWKHKTSLRDGIKQTYEHLKSINFAWKER